MTVCVSGIAECVGEQTPQPPVCNYADNDCNGIIDGVSDAATIAFCTSPACEPLWADAGIQCWGPQLGICGAGVETCEAGCFEIVHAGVPEVCNGLDDDCNGLIDDGLTAIGPCAVPDGAALGECQKGSLTCVNPSCDAAGRVCTFTEECEPSLPKPEICNGLDDNCNGIIDDHACATPNDVDSGQTYCCHGLTDAGGYTCAAFLGDGGVGQSWSCQTAGP